MTFIIRGLLAAITTLAFIYAIMATVHIVRAADPDPYNCGPRNERCDPARRCGARCVLPEKPAR
jgi:hypothetical protein